MVGWGVGGWGPGFRVYMGVPEIRSTPSHNKYICLHYGPIVGSFHLGFRARDIGFGVVG